MKKSTIIFDILIVCFAFVLGVLISNLFQETIDIPQGNSEERDSPSNWIDDSQINVYEDKVILHLDDIRFVELADTNSMDPILDSDANAIEIEVKKPNRINKGDIISFEIETGETYIHRVVKKDYDSEGLYFITKGDNNENEDPLIVRPSKIKGVVVGIVY